MIDIMNIKNLDNETNELNELRNNIEQLKLESNKKTETSEEETETNEEKKEDENSIAQQISEQYNEKIQNYVLSVIKNSTVKDLNLIVEKYSVDIIKYNNKKYKSKNQIIKLNKTKKTNLLKKLIIEVKINTNDVLNIHFNKNHKLTLNNIDNTDMFLKYLKSNHPLDLATFLNDNRLKNFNNECELKLEKMNNNKKGKLLNNSKIQALNCDETFKQKKQGLYILSVYIDNIWKIIKLGSFAETQGLCGRLSSFGGGSYETGSGTNKWFIKYVSFLLENNMRVKFNYYLKEVKPIIIEDDLLTTETEIIPYLIRALETELFKIYFELNKNRNPIFGSNCT